MSQLGPSKEKTNGTKLARLLVDGGTSVLRNILFSIHPRDKLEQVLKDNKHNKLKRAFNDQKQKLFPPTGPPQFDTFDLTLLIVLLQKICDLKPPGSTGWNEMPSDNDKSRLANIVRINCFRNYYGHWFSTGIPDDEFDEKWNNISSALVELGLDQDEIDCLKTGPIDHDTQRRVEEEVNKWKREFESRVEDVERRQDNSDQRQGAFEQRLDESERRQDNFEERQDISDERQSNFEERQHNFDDRIFTVEEKLSQDTTLKRLSNCLPDEVQHVYGRSEEIREIVDGVQSGNNALTSITGGPGFGKTTVAKAVAHELARAENERTVLFCSFLSLKNFHDVATAMIHSCGTIFAQPLENPELWLKNWSKRIQTQVTFVLDNADDVLESGDRSVFLRTLSAVRMLSKQHVTFIITTRKAFNDPDLQPRQVRLDLVSAEAAKDIIFSRVTDPDVRQKLSKIAKMVELCGCAPLALCIVGSLLSDFSEDNLIKCLEEEPLNVLEDDEASVAKAIKASFDLLTKDEQDVFVLLSVFPGPFNSNDAEFVLEACLTSGSPAVSVLRSLKNRSLLEQPCFCRYQIHPLIHAFGNNIGLDRCQQLLDRGKKKACIHFISRFTDNANANWSKDKCKASMEYFNEDRHNFEYFLKVYVQERKQKDPEIMDACKTFFDNLQQKCIYLEMCVRPSFHTFILETLLETVDPEFQPLRRVELLCLLGHEKRKEGDQPTYEKLMEEAEKIHAEKSFEFKTNASSEVFFRISFSRFLIEKKDPNESPRIIQEIEIALDVSRAQLGDHSLTAAALSLAGIHAKRRKNYDEAKPKLQEALKIYEKFHGKHVITARAFKNIADFHLQRATESTRQISDSEMCSDLKQCLELYANAISMLEDLGMGNTKEIILTRKNLSVCHREKGNFKEALAELTKAEEVAEREFEEDHTWKVFIKNELAYLFEKMEKREKAIEEMKAGLSMAKRLSLSIDKMAGRRKIREFINQYPDEFPDEDIQGSVGTPDCPQPTNDVSAVDDYSNAVDRDPRNVSVSRSASENPRERFKNCCTVL